MGSSLYGIVIAGDYLDLYTLGSYNNESLANLSNITLQDEYLDGLQGIDEMNSAFKGAKKLFLFGNHEDRYFRHIKEKDNAKYGGALINPVEALYLHERGWITKTDWQSDYFTLGKHLDIVHGVYTSIHAAKAHLDKTQHSVMFGHTHRVQCFHQGNRAAFNIGGLYDIKSKGFNYMPRFQRQLWANGFALVNVTDNGDFYVEQVNVWADKFLANGKMY
jgi:predicted phosphodiesterase